MNATWTTFRQVRLGKDFKVSSILLQYPKIPKVGPNWLAEVQTIKKYPVFPLVKKTFQKKSHIAEKLKGGTLKSHQKLYVALIKRNKSFG